MARSPLITAATALLRSAPVMRAPIWLYRARLGALLGPRLLMLEHRGRRSGLPRYVVLEVLGRPEPGRYLVASGFGEKAQWFRNITADPRVRVTVGSHAPAPATAHRLPQPEADRALAAYIEAHPRAWARFREVLERTLGTPVTAVNTALPIVAVTVEAADLPGYC